MDTEPRIEYLYKLYLRAYGMACSGHEFTSDDFEWAMNEDLDEIAATVLGIDNAALGMPCDINALRSAVGDMTTYELEFGSKAAVVAEG